MRKNLTEIVFILDRSGSMSGLEADTIGGFNSMIEKQKKAEGEALISTVLFDNTSEVIHDRVNVHSIKPMTDEDYTVRGCTALLDAIGGAIHHIGNVHKYARAEDVPEHTMFVITTDGMENASRRYDSDKVKKMIERQKEKYGWEFLFLGANIDAVETARHFGISEDRAVNYHSDSEGTQLNYEVVSEAKMLVSSYGCAAETAAQEFEWTRKIAEQQGMNSVKIIARHVIQSFDVGEVSPELAHEIGKQFADEILGGKYEYVLTTHIDKDHVHNHLIFNAVDFVDHHAYKSYKKIYYDMREASDRLCKENGLSVIPPSRGKGMSYKEYTEAKRGTSWKQKLKQTIDRNIITAKD